MNLVSRKLAALTSTHQIDALYACNRIGSKVDAEIDKLWRKLLRLLAQAHKRGLQSQQLIWSYTLAPTVAALINQMHDAARANLRQQFTRLVKWGHRSAANVLASTLPIKTMKVAARWPARRRQPIRLLEDDPGAILLRLGIGGELQATDRLGRLREPVRDELSDEEQRELLRRLLFPSLSQNRIADILLYPVAGLNWQQDLTAATKLADPFTIANILGSGFAAGKQPREVAKLLEPAVQGVKSTARRVARTYGMQIAHRAQMDAHAAIADLIVGYQVHGVLDHVTRSWHAARSGTIYYLEPKPGQKGPQQMPHPPLEAEDLRERPPGTPRLAPNCRCMTGDSIVFADVKWIMRALYDGEAIEIRTRSGARFTVTANHPVATTSGFVFADQINKGDYLISDGISFSQLADHVKHRPAVIKDVFESMAIRFGLAIAERPNALEFHGDGRSIQSQVHIVGADLRLMNNCDVTIIESKDCRDFIGRTSGSMRHNHVLGPLLAGHPEPFQILGLRLAANGHAGLHEHSDQSERFAITTMHAATLKAVGISECLQGLSSKVSLDEIGRTFISPGQAGRFRFRAECDPCLYEPVANGVAFDSATSSDFGARFASEIPCHQVGRNRIAPSKTEALSTSPNGHAFGDEHSASNPPLHAEFLANLRARHSTDIGPDDVVGVRRFHLASWIYSVDTGLGYYMASGSSGPAVMQGNCYLTPVLTAAEELVSSPEFQNAAEQLIPDPLTYSDWFERADEAKRRLAVGSRRYATMKRDLHRQPSWEHFVDPDTGRLLELTELQAEEPQARAERVRRMRELLAQRGMQRREVARLGFLKG